MWVVEIGPSALVRHQDIYVHHHWREEGLENKSVKPLNNCLYLIQSVLRKMKREDALIISDQVMTSLLQMFKSSNMRAGGVQEDALLAVGTLVEGTYISLI